VAKRKGKAGRLEADPVRKGREAAEDVVAFFSAGGLDASVKQDTTVEVEGQRLRIKGQALTSLKQRDRWLDDVVSKRFAAKLQDALVAHFKGAGTDLRASKGKRGFVLHRDRQPVALVRATSTRVRDGRLVQGNFLAPGAHWERLRHAIRERDRSQNANDEAELTSHGSVLKAFPESVADEIHAAAMEASKDLRENRHLVFGHPVLIESGGRRIRFDPLETRQRALQAPFRYVGSRGAVVGALRLRTPNDPLALALADGDDPKLIGEAWSLALVAYRELTCVEPDDAARVLDSTLFDRRSRRRSPGARGEPTKHARHRGQMESPLNSRLQFSPRLIPTVETRGYLASYVAGHRRRLVEGQEASVDARRRAEEVGIRLRDAETWVRPHARGLPSDAILQFTWAMPRSLSRALKA
jgi:hypothetical protein